MPKIMLVEDDINLSEIYQARLQAEGYDIVATKDGEEALATAVKEKPDLIICDVMMPKISGFEMLDILRGTEGVKNTKVIMMTALNQAEDKARAQNLGADRYLVKSQVTLEDVVKVAKDVLQQPAPANPVPAAAPAGQTPPQGSTPSNPAPTAVVPAAPAPPSSTPQPLPTPAVTPAAAIPAVPQEVAQTMTEPILPQPSIPTPAATPTPQTPITAPVTLPTEQSTSQPLTPPPAAISEPQPTETPVPTPSFSSAEPANSAIQNANAQTAAEEENTITQQIENFIGQQPPTAPAEQPSTPPSTAAPTVPTPPALPPLPTPTQTTPPVTTEAVSSAPTPQLTNVPVATPPELPVAPTIAQTMTEPAPEPTTPTPPTAPAAPTNDGVVIPGKKVIQPLNDPTAKPDLEALLIKEQLKEGQNTTATPQVTVGGANLPPAGSTGYLQSSGGQPGQSNPNQGLGPNQPNITL